MFAMFRRTPVVLTLTLVVLVGGCASEEPTQPGDAASIGEYILGLSPDVDGMLNVQDTGTQDMNREELSTERTTEQVPDVGTKVCVRTSYNLKQNFDRVAILRPTTGVVYPGALVKANQAALDGLPEPVTLSRAPIILSIDLPGMGSNGIVTVQNPTHSNVQAAIDDALEWWNANAYQDGYVNAANSVYNYASSYSAEQSALDVGLNIAWATGDFAGKFSTFTSNTTSVITAAFQQAFYTATFDTPLDPEDVFAPSVSLADVQAEIDEAAPPAYVSSVVYGRILVFRMENSNSVTTTDLQAAFNYGVGRISASGDVALKYQRILSESKIEAITIGGNAEVASELVTGNLIGVITGPNAVYSRSNPGVPIAYTLRQLGRDRVVRMGYTTEYTSTECELAAMEVTLSFGNISVPGDCDGIEGDGEFDWELRILNAGGGTISSASGSDTVPAGSSINVGKKLHVFNLTASEGQRFVVRIKGSEWDRDIFGSTWRDTRLSNATAEYTHVYRDGLWNSNAQTLVVGSTSDCKLSVSYSFTARQI